MAYRLERTDVTLEKGLRRIAQEQIESALQAVAQADKRPDWAIHDVRKRCKKLRALLRLVRFGLDNFRAEDARFRDTARLLAWHRDRDVLLNSFDTLVELPDLLDRRAIEEARSALTWVEGVLTLEKDVLQQAHALLAEALRGAAQWRLAEPGWGAVCGGFIGTYRKGRKAMRRAAEEPTAEHHHDWRKYAGMHWFHARLLQGVWPERMARRVAPAKRLAELLGDHHDLFVLEERVAAAVPEADAEVLIAVARRRRAEIERRAHRLGNRLFEHRAGRWQRRCRESLASRPR